MKTYSARALAVLVLLVGPGAQADEKPADCSTCHQQAPLPPGHMPVAEVSAGTCFLCHQAAADDGLFVAIHQKHPSLECSHCHGEAADDDARRQKLDSMLGGR